MAGFPIGIKPGLGAVSGLGNIVTGSDSLVFRLASVEFVGFEIPESLTLGGTQMSSTQQFFGGARNIQTFGPTPPVSITWSASLIGNTAMSRMRELDSLRSSGLKVELAYGPSRYRGIVKKFDPNIRHQFLIAYALTFNVEQDLTASSVAVSTNTSESIFRKLQLDTTAQLDLYVSRGSPLPSTLMSRIRSTISDIDDQLRLHGQQFAAIDSLVLNHNLRALATVISTVAAFAGDIGGDGPSPFPLSQFKDLSTFNQAQSDALDIIPKLRQMHRAASSPFARTRTVLVINPNLYELAATYLGSASSWPVIAKANNLTDPMPKGRFRLVIPRSE